MALSGPDYDTIVVGAGIVGIATAWTLQQQRPDWRILLLDKEADIARHQTGHNSGVIHAGVYYPPDSLKARFCREGLNRTIAFCQQHHIPYRQCGKLIVARNRAELPGLDHLYQRARSNSLSVERLSAADLPQYEPRLRGAGAIRVADTAVVNYREVARCLLDQFAARGGELAFSTRVQALQERSNGVVVQTSTARFNTRQVICCGGLMADRLVRMMGLPCDFRIIPFRGEYYRLAPRCDNWFNHLVYPVPDPLLPFLGVHLTLALDGSLTAGPNALLGLAREGYGRWQLNREDVLEMLRFPGFWRLLRRYWRAGLGEMCRASSRRRYVRRLQEYCPDLEQGDLLPHRAGVRAQAVGLDGALIHDFHFVQSRHSLHVGNAPSPAATSAFPIAEHIVARLLQKVD